MELKGKKVAILVEEIFNDLEFWYPYYRLKEAGAKVVVVGSGSSQVFTGKSGSQVKPDTSAEKISVDDVDGVIIPGGYAPDHMRRYPAMVKVVRDLKDDLIHAGATFEDKEVVVDGTLITSRKPDDLPAFMKAVIAAL